MSDKYVLATDDNGNLAVRTVSAEESPTANSTDVITATTDGKLAVRVVGAGGGGGGDQHNLGWYATESALTTAHPTATAGDFAIVGSTDTVWVWDTDNEEWVDSDQKGQVTSVNGQTGAVTVDTLPDQTGQSGKFLTTDGTDASWSDKPLVNTATGTYSLSIAGTASTSYGTVNVGVGSNVTGSYGVAVGYNASGKGVSIGYNTKADDVNNIAIGNTTRITSGQGSVCVGGQITTNKARTIMVGNWLSGGAVDTILIGFGQNTSTLATNSESGTMAVALRKNDVSVTYKLLDYDGTIPTDRLTKVNTTITLTAADWSSNTQTVNVTGMTADGVVMVSPAPADQSAYTSAGIICSAQAAGTLTFTCSTTPTADLSVNVVCL